MVKCPAFFKYYVAEQNVGKMKIPIMFIRSIQEKLPENVVLRDRYNNLWQMRLEKEGDFWYFKDGWTKFVNDNMIQSMDIILYEYFSEGLFYFKIFGPSACETKGVGGPIYKDTMIESDDDVDDSDDEDYVSTIHQEENEQDATDGDIDNEDYLATTREDIEQDYCPQGGLVRDVVASTSTCGSKRKRKHDWYGADIFGCGLFPQPRNPYFVTSRRQNRGADLYIPMDVSKYYNLEFPQVIILVDPSGRKFEAKRKIRIDGKMFYVGGWKGLCRVNFLGIDDQCVCEFVKEDDGKLYLNVSFFDTNRQQGRDGETK